MDEVFAEEIHKTTDMALWVGAPVIGLNDSAADAYRFEVITTMGGTPDLLDGFLGAPRS